MHRSDSLSERVKLYDIALGLLSPKIIPLVLCEIWWSSDSFLNQFSSQNQQRSNLEKNKCEYFSAGFVSWTVSPKCLLSTKVYKEKRKVSHAGNWVKKEGMGLISSGSNELLDQLSCNKSITSLREKGTGSGSCPQHAAFPHFILVMARA